MRDKINLFLFGFILASLLHFSYKNNLLMIILITKQIKHNLECSLLVLPEQLEGLHNPKTLMNCLRVYGVIAAYSVRDPLTAV